jgi:hypothetical protein
MPKFFRQARRTEEQYDKDKPRFLTAEELKFRSRLPEQTVKDMRKLVKDGGKKKARRIHSEKLRRTY